MKSEKNSFVVNLRLAVSKVFEIMGTFTADCVTVYAAQATFYIIMSSIPFLMLLISLSRYVIPEAIDSLFTAVRQIIPDKFTDLFTVIYNEINNHAGISILSITALTALWSSSRSVAAVVRGVAFIYDTDGKVTPMRDLLYSILYTLAFVAIILGALVILVFGATIKNIVIYKFPRLENVVSLILSLRGVFFFVVLSLFFSLVYFAVSKGIIRSSGTLRKYRSAARRGVCVSRMDAVLLFLLALSAILPFRILHLRKPCCDHAPYVLALLLYDNSACRS